MAAPPGAEATAVVAGIGDADLDIGTAANIESKVIWNYAQATKLHIDTAAIEHAFKDFFAEDRGVSRG